MLLKYCTVTTKSQKPFLVIYGLLKAFVTIIWSLETCRYRFLLLVSFKKKLKPCLVKPIITETLSGYLRITEALSLCLVTSRLSNPCLVIPQSLRGLLSYPSIIRTLSSYLQITNPRMVTSGLMKSPSSCLRILQACLFTWGLLKIKTLSLVTSGPPKPCLFLRGH